MPFFQAEPFFEMAKTYKIVDIGGRFGSGKTTLAFALAGWLLKNAGFRYLFSNCRSVWNDNPLNIELRPNEAGELQYLDAVIVLDEGGLFLRYGRDADEFTAFLRKMNIVLILPTFETPAKKLRAITVQRIMNLQRFGIPVWQYQYRLRDAGNKETWSFWWAMYQEGFGVFDTLANPVDDSGLSDFLADVKDQLVERELRKQEIEGMRYKSGIRNFLEVSQDGRVSRNEPGIGDYTSVSDGAISPGMVTRRSQAIAGLADVDLIQDAIGELADTVQEWTSVSHKVRKSRGR